MIDILTKGKLDGWIYSDQGPHVDREEWTVKFPPIMMPSCEGLLKRVAKIVGVSDDLEAAAKRTCKRNAASTSRLHASQPYYLDVTHPKANKGEVVNVFSEMLHVPAANIATIGDMPNDVFMFKRSGVSIAMGNASSDVQHAARFVTCSNKEEGFALAMERFVLRAQVA